MTSGQTEECAARQRGHQRGGVVGMKLFLHGVHFSIAHSMVCAIL
jgi:hypothetical protein